MHKYVKEARRRKALRLLDQLAIARAQGKYLTAFKDQLLENAREEWEADYREVEARRIESWMRLGDNFTAGTSEDQKHLKGMRKRVEFLRFCQKHDIEVDLGEAS